tara:strand:- start:980 stop:1138 length:159 start_codon:yes stop_codon:yes gene_type:complete
MKVDLSAITKRLNSTIKKQTPRITINFAEEKQSIRPLKKAYGLTWQKTKNKK